MASNSSPQQDAATQTNKKRVFLIRHAESEENRRLASLTRCAWQLGRWKVPSRDDVTASAELLNVAGQVDSNVSDKGKAQIAYMGRILKDDFLETIELIAHSPLLRARQTCEGVLGCDAQSASEKEGVVNHRVVELDDLREKTLQEWMPLNSQGFIDRIHKFEGWLGEQKEDPVAIVGHSQFFKAMLGLDFKFANCDVWEVWFDPSRSSCCSNKNETTTEAPEISASDAAEQQTWTLKPGWSGLRKLYRCEIPADADANHP